MLFNKKWENCILPLLIVGISALFMGVLFDFHFDLNDDTMMRDIMSGVYCGAPDGHNMQTLYPLGAAIALCYRISDSVPWYGLFLFLCQFGCFFAVGVRLCVLSDAACARIVSENGPTGDNAGTGRRFAWKLFCLLGLVFFQWGIWLTHMVNMQYTITCAMLSGTAVFLFLTVPRLGERRVSEAVPEALSVKGFWLKSLPSLLFFLLAFQLRSEMALLTLPFLGLAGIFCWWEESPVLTGENLKKYGGLFLLLLAGMGFSLGADSLAYGGEWKEFRQFFQDRTTVYDYYLEVVTEDAYEAELENLGVSPAAQMLLRNYNFGLDEGIDAQLLSDVAAYAKDCVGGARDWGKIFREKFLLYRYRSFHGGDAPYNLLVWLGYAANIIAVVILLTGSSRESHGDGVSGNIFLRRRNLLRAGVQLALLFLMRSAIWMFILMRGRDPERITHSLYLVEFCLLAGLFLRRLRCAGEVFAQSAPKAGGIAPRVADSAAVLKLLIGAAAVFSVLSAWGLWKTVPAVHSDQERRQETNADWEAIDAYCRARQGVFFFEDVYSTVAFSGKLLERGNPVLANYDIAGGWMCKSPLYCQKLAVFGIEDAADALLTGKAYFIMSDDERELRGLDWLTDIYAEKGMDAEIAESDRISENYCVYRVRTAEENDSGAE